MCAACGVKHVVVVDPFDQKEMQRVLKEETAREEVSVIIARRPCVLLLKDKTIPATIENCRDCGVCLGLGCPAIERGDHGMRINGALCVDCGLCVDVCPFKAIHAGRESK